MVYKQTPTQHYLRILSGCISVSSLCVVVNCFIIHSGNKSYVIFDKAYITIFTRSYFHNPLIIHVLPVSRGAFYRHTMLANTAPQSDLLADRAEALQNYLRENQEDEMWWKLKNSSICGRGLFATKAMQQGTLIFINRPLVVAPRAACANDNFCYYCYKQGDCYPCEQCSLLVCSEECRTGKEHNVECNFISENWKLKANHSKDSMVLCKMLIYLRTLMLNEEQSKIISILQKDSEPPVFEDLEILCSRYEIPVAQIEFMKTINSIFKTNAFRISNDSLKRKVALRGLYPLSSLMNHNCIPNTRNIFRNDYSMAVYASKDIETGEEILSCYTGQLWCTAARRCHLYKTKKFWCKCARCGDNTEMGTNLSALKCFNKNCSGIILPVVPLNPNTEWHCNCCGAIELPERVNGIQSLLGSLTGTLSLDGRLQLDPPVLKRLNQFVPQTNHILVDLHLRMAFDLGNSDGVQINGIEPLLKLTPMTMCGDTVLLPIK